MAELGAGMLVGHFRIERRLGAGGMGEVYLATDLALDRPVAIKVLPAAVARDPARRDRLVREARAQARVNHPNIAHIYFIGEDAGRLYFAMEYVAGQTVADRLALGPLSVDAALSIIRSAALGLREAQASGITHRDIKPDNLFILESGRLKVLDFGIARVRAGAGKSLKTQTGKTLGTVSYMAPEQARGEGIDFRADVYALGATLFHLVAGRPPFEADTLDALLSKHASAERPALPRRSGTPRTAIAAIDALCSRMMAPFTADRFASYDELIRAIELASIEHAQPAGLWARSIAGLIDLLVGGLIGAAVITLIRLAIFRSPDGDAGPNALAGYAAYATFFVAWKGRTLGHWLFDLEVVDVATGACPTLARAAVRVVVPVAPLFLVTLFNYIVRFVGYGLDDLPYILILVLVPLALLWAPLRSVSKQTVWDKLSRTMVRYRTRRTSAL